MYRFSRTYLGQRSSIFSRKKKAPSSLPTVSMLTTASIIPKQTGEEAKGEGGKEQVLSPFQKKEKVSPLPLSLYTGQLVTQNSVLVRSSSENPESSCKASREAESTIISEDTNITIQRSKESSILSSQQWALSKIRPFSEHSPMQLRTESTTVLPTSPTTPLIPDSLEYYLMDEKKRETLLPLSKRLNKLYQKIMCLTLDSDPMTPHNLEALEAKFDKGLLMTSAEDDAFARTHKLHAIKEKFDNWYAVWEGRNRLDHQGASEMERQDLEKTSVLTYALPQYQIPNIGSDPCPGCGAPFQCDNEKEFGYLTHHHIHNWLARYSLTLKDRTEYAERRYRLLCHWAEHGKQFGEEWLDFMTDQEFRAIHLYQLRPVVCARCLALKNYRTSSEDTIMSAEDFREQLWALRDEKGLFIFVADLSNFNGTLIRDLRGLATMNNPVLVVGNKLDLIQRTPMETNKELHRKVSQSHAFYRAWVFDQLRQHRIERGHLMDIMIVSARRGWYIRQLAERIDQLCNITRSRPGGAINAFLVGCTNVGKSSLLNSLMRYYGSTQPPHPEAKREYYLRYLADGTSKVEWKWNVPPHASPADLPHVKIGTNKVRLPKIATTSPIPGTTIRMVGLPLVSEKDKITLYDTPGVIPSWQHRTVLNLREQAQCSIQVPPQRRILPQYYKLAENSTLFMSGLVCIDVLQCSPYGVFFGVYCSLDVSHRCINTERAEETWRQNVGTLLKPPYNPNVVSEGLKKQKKYLFECENNISQPKADIYFNGLGWITFYSPTADVYLRVRAHESVEFGVRPPLRYKDLLWRQLLAKFRRKGKRDTKNHPWGVVNSHRKCRGNPTTPIKKPQTILRLIDEPIDPKAPAGPVPDTIEKDFMNKKETIRQSLTPPIDHTKTPFEEIIATLRKQGRLKD